MSLCTKMIVTTQIVMKMTSETIQHKLILLIVNVCVQMLYMYDFNRTRCFKQVKKIYIKYVYNIYTNTKSKLSNYFLII